ncbi:MAG: bifunctional riboflavin kinase/FAD synthetase [candidate division Zixibacteria bacterium]|nr:bifunctional riboflavin kinase/FAD synthetase [candidate division Zixibacteria bacterium]
MKTTFVHGLENLAPFSAGSTVVTLGTFDGIHRGHQAIFARVREVAKNKQLTSVLVTFHPHPRTVVTPDNIPMLLTTIEEKQRFVPCFFEGTVIVVNFNESLRNLSAEQFVKQVLVERIGVKHLIVGYDHGLGKDRGGNTETLERLGQEFGFDLEVVKPVIWNDAPISSTRIRQALTYGKYDFAVELLGHDYAIFGTVERGIGLGKKLGYPTANVKYSQWKLLPPEGVYACWVQLGKEERGGMMFVGQNHFNPVARLTVEVNLFDFDRDIYDEETIVYPTRYVRQNRRFPSTESLVAQIKQDKEQILEILEKQGERTCH